MRAVLLPLLLAACTVATSGPDPVAPPDGAAAEPTAALPVAAPNPDPAPVAGAAEPSLERSARGPPSGVESAARA
jgi:hypothetical protein